MVIPIVFLVLFIIFVYGALWVGSLGLANWLLHSAVLKLYLPNLVAYLLQQGVLGVIITSIVLLAIWVGCNFGLSYILYLIIRKSGRKIAAHKIYNISLMALFHIFFMPIILWSILRQKSVYLKHKYYAKLRKLAKTKLMEERLKERKLKSCG